MAEKYLQIVESAKAKIQGNMEVVPSLVSPFVGKPASKWLEEAAQTPVPKMLFDQFWFEGELCVLFASTNTGKSILAFQVAVYIASEIPNKNWKMTAHRQTVLFFDFELSKRQFAKRYSEVENERYMNLYQFPERLIRYELGEVVLPKGMDLVDYYIEGIRAKVLETGARVIIIDNITWLNHRLEKASDAGGFMQKLNKLKREEELSILLIAHTPKRDATQPITINDLAGSAQLMNFMDSAFAIGCSTQDPQLRYIKQIKVRECEKVYGEDNVIVCMLEKVGNFLQFTFQSYGSERDHLRTYKESDKAQRDADILELYEALKSYREVGKQLGVSHQTVKRVVDRAKAESESRSSPDDDEDPPW
ncbi:AAA family ATPase [Phaeodactylibacter xiamenensis]|uniref:AAA family ATPase n=1 Tax=Phaeodactylibacter xiamenensis TaxID=1524460 RepID=UPI0024A891DD|nr:AAA family ATPase [Phaeodactylibacter xiamenensis]